MGSKRSAGLQDYLALDDGVARVGPGGGCLEAQGEVEHILRTCVDDAMVRHGDLRRLTGWHGGERKRLLLHDVAITQKLIGEIVEVGQVGEGQLVAERKRARCGVPVGESSRSIDGLHLGQFGRPSTVGRDDSVVEEIALEAVTDKLGGIVVVARHPVVETILHPHTTQEVGGPIDRLVHPVPDATSDDIVVVRVLDDVPVVLEVADGLAHGVGIL